MTGSGLVRLWAPFLLIPVFLVFLAPQTHAQVSLAPSALGFGSVLVGKSQSQTVTLTNTGSRALTVSRAGVSGTGFGISALTYPFSLAVGQSAVLQVSFTPTAAGSDTGSVWVSSYSGSRRYHRRTATVALTGSGVAAAAGQITASPAALSFGSLATGHSQSLSTTLTNTGSTSVTVSQASSSSAAFAMSGLSLPTTLAAGKSVTFGIVFTPTVAGATSGKLAITSSASNPLLNITLSGSGTAAGQLSLAPSALNFGSIATGASAALSGTLTASGSPVTVASAGSTSAEFVLSGISFPVTVAAGQSMPFTVTFRPQTSGAATASLSFLSNAATSPTTEGLTGSGTGAVAHSVTLSWKASTSSGVVGYNLYRATAAGGPYAQVISRDASPTYTDTSVAGGQTYFYVVTAVDGAGTESVYSNQAQAAVPTP